MSYNRTNTFNDQISKSNNSFIVNDEYRTNSLSLQPGGTTVKVHYENGKSRIYDKIKNVEAYTRFMENKFDVIGVEAMN